eukprot:jgi/Mesvir1/12392/Mv00565-RA.1
MGVSGLSRGVALLATLTACFALIGAHEDSKICGQKNFFLRGSLRGSNSRWDTLVPDQCSVPSLAQRWTPACSVFIRVDLDLKESEGAAYEPLDGTFVGTCVTTEHEWQLLCTHVLEVPAVGTLTSVDLVHWGAVYPAFSSPQTWSSGSRGFEGVTGTSKVRTLVLFDTVEYEFHLERAPRCGDARVFTFAAIGDLPYGVGNADHAQLDAMPAFVQAINQDNALQLVLHVGDIHSGSSHCYEAYNWRVFNAFKEFNVPLVYTPGDNEWADCHNAKEGGWTYTTTSPWPCLNLTGNLGPCDSYYDPVADGGSHYPGDPLDNLELVRRIFFPRPGSTLARHKSVLSQSRAYDPAYPADAKYLEHVMFVEADVLFVALNIPGGSNNEGDAWHGAPKTQRQLDAVAERTGATIRWLDRAFAHAWEEDTKGIVLMYQADFWKGDPSKLSGYTPIVQAIYNHVRSFGRSVLALHGDSHEFKSDNPFANTNAVYLPQNTQYGTLAPVTNFHRIVVHGETLPMEYLRVTVNADSYYGYGSGVGASKFGPFKWTRLPQPSVL